MNPKLDEDYLEEHFPKGDKRRGEVMVLLALARIQGKQEYKMTSKINKLVEKEK